MLWPCPRLSPDQLESAGANIRPRYTAASVVSTSSLHVCIWEGIQRRLALCVSGLTLRLSLIPCRAAPCVFSRLRNLQPCLSASEVLLIKPKLISELLITAFCSNIVVLFFSLPANPRRSQH